MIIGICGKANVGKSTFFKAATLAEVEIANYPFTTIASNEGIGFVKTKCIEEEFNTKCQPKKDYCLDGNRFVPVKLIDVAGLVPGAHKGLGRGNEFLDDLRQADAFIHVIDVSGSTNEKGETVEKGSYDPGNDIRFLEEELDMWYFQIIKKGWEKFARTYQQEGGEINQAIAKQLSGLKVDEDHVKECVGDFSGKPLEWSDDDLKKLASKLRRMTKKMIIACNKIDIENARDNFEKLKEEFPDDILIGCSAESELALRNAAKHELIKYVPGERDFELIKDISEEQKKGLNFIKENVLKHGSTGVQEVLDKAVFELLSSIAVYPVANSHLEDKDGNKLPDCFLVPKGITALDFAFKVHSDIGESFVRAIDMKTKQTIGKDHQLKDGDVVEIVSDK